MTPRNGQYHQTLYDKDGVTVEMNRDYSLPLELTYDNLSYEIYVEGTSVATGTLNDFPATGVSVSANEGYDVSLSSPNDKITFGASLTVWGDDAQLVISVAAQKSGDSIEIANGDEIYGTFSWTKGTNVTCAYLRTLTVRVNGETVHSQKVATPLTLDTLTNPEFWFTPDTTKYNAEYTFDSASYNSATLVNMTLDLTTKCQCGQLGCQCEGGAECSCEEGCPCDKCVPNTENTIATPYGTISYVPADDNDLGNRTLKVELYINGEAADDETNQKLSNLKIEANRAGGILFNPANGYYFHHYQNGNVNGYDLNGELDGEQWDPIVGTITLAAEDPDFVNVLKIYVWTFDQFTSLDVNRSSDTIDQVNGYTITFMANDPQTGKEREYTYNATSFSATELQHIPVGKDVKLTASCESPYEVSEWLMIHATSVATLTGSEGEDVIAANQYAKGNAANLKILSAGLTEVVVTITDVRTVTPPRPEDLTGDDGDIFANGIAVIVDCVNDEASHDDANYGLTAGSFEISELKGDSVSGYYVEVTVDPASYVDNYNDIYPDDTHDRTDEDKKVIRLNWEVVTNQDGSKTSAWKAEAPATIKVTCGEVVNEPTKPTSVEIDTLLDVMVTCQNNPNHNKTFTELPADSYEISAPALNKDTYECTVTITADSYIAQMAGDHKIVDGTPDSKKVLLAYVNDQWIVANEEEATVSFLAECVAPEAPDNITVAGLLKDVTVTCDEHNSKTYDIADTTITVDKSSLRYDENNEAFIVKVSVAAQNYVDQYIGDFGPHTLNDNESKTVTLLYQNGSWGLANKDAKVEFKVKCDTPDKPEYDEIAELLGDVTVTCDVHGTKTYKLSDGNYEVGGIQGGGYGALVKVTVFGAAYVDKFEAEHNNVAHKLVGSEQITISLVYQKDGWMIDSSDLGKTIAFQVTCKPDAPTTDEVDALKIKNAVTLDCINTSVNHADVTYDLKSGSYTIGEVVNGGNDLYYVSLTVRPDAYVRDYDKATGSTHTWPGNDYGIINLYWNNDTQAWETRGDYGVKFLVKCSTVTVPGDGGNNNDTPKDEHPDIAEGIANGTWGGTPTPTPAASATSTIPQTSDSMPIGLLAGTAAIAAAAIALLLVLRKRRQQ